MGRAGPRRANAPRRGGTPPAPAGKQKGRAAAPRRAAQQPQRRRRRSASRFRFRLPPARDAAPRPTNLCGGARRRLRGAEERPPLHRNVPLLPAGPYCRSVKASPEPPNPAGAASAVAPGIGALPAKLPRLGPAGSHPPLPRGAKGRPAPRVSCAASQRCPIRAGRGQRHRLESCATASAPLEGQSRRPLWIQRPHVLPRGAVWLGYPVLRIPVAPEGRSQCFASRARKRSERFFLLHKCMLPTFGN